MNVAVGLRQEEEVPASRCEHGGSKGQVDRSNEADAGQVLAARIQLAGG